LPPTALSLLAALEGVGRARAERLASDRPRREVAAEGRLLETRLLAFAQQSHTESGAHAKELETWTHWACRVGLAAEPLAAAAARKTLEAACAGLEQTSAAPAAPAWRLGPRSPRKARAR
jgi:hypothetical protein